MAVAPVSKISKFMSLIKEKNGSLYIQIPADIIEQEGLEQRVLGSKSGGYIYKVTPVERARYALEAGKTYDFVMTASVDGFIVAAKPAKVIQVPVIPTARVQVEAEPEAASEPAPLRVITSMANDQLIKVPAMDLEMRTYMPPSEHRMMSDLLMTRTRSGQIVNVIATGPRSSGKTSFFQWHAAKHKLPYFLLNAGSIRDTGVWFGLRELLNGETVFIKSALVQALEMGNCVVVLDEGDRADPQHMTALFGVLDYQREAVIAYSGNQKIVVGPGTVIAVTANAGTDQIATFEMNKAFQSRMTTRMEFSRPEDEDLVEAIISRTGADRELVGNLVALKNQLHAAVEDTSSSEILENDIDVRQILEVSEWTQTGMPLSMALKMCILNHYSNDGNIGSQRARVISIIRGMGFVPDMQNDADDAQP